MFASFLGRMSAAQSGSKALQSLRAMAGLTRRHSGAGQCRTNSPSTGVSSAGLISLVAWALRRELPGALQDWALEFEDTLVKVSKQGRATSVALQRAGELRLPLSLELDANDLIVGCRYKVLYSPGPRRLWWIKLIDRPSAWADAPLKRPDWL